MSDLIVDEARRIREALIEQHGGIDGYFKHCQQQDKDRIKRLKARRRKRAARSPTTTRTA